MLELKSKIDYEYNSKLDILYITLKESDDTFGHEDDYGIVQNYDYTSKELVGFDVWDFKFKMNNNIPIPLPTDINLKGIYESL